MLFAVNTRYCKRKSIMKFEIKKKKTLFFQQMRSIETNLALLRQQLRGPLAVSRFRPSRKTFSGPFHRNTRYDTALLGY